MARSSLSCSSSLFVAGGALVAAMVLASVIPQVSAGPLFEIALPILPDAPDSYLIVFNQSSTPRRSLLQADEAGSVTSSNNPFAGTKYSPIPSAKLSLKKCGVLSTHFHPLGTEQLFVYKGSFEIGMFLEDGSFRKVTVEEGNGVIIPQGAVHYVKNAHCDTSEAFQIYDHPQAGIQFVGPALLSMPKNILKSSFTGCIPDDTTTTFFTVSDCPY